MSEYIDLHNLKDKIDTMKDKEKMKNIYKILYETDDIKYTHTKCHVLFDLTELPYETLKRINKTFD